MLRSDDVQRDDSVVKLVIYVSGVATVGEKHSGNVVIKHIADRRRIVDTSY